ncbi:hypothetical protein ACFX12_024693 [Malus domestica]
MKIKGEHREENIEESKLPLQLEESRSATKGSKEVRRIRGQQLAKQRKWRSPHGGRKKRIQRRGERLADQRNRKRGIKAEGKTGNKGVWEREKGAALWAARRRTKKRE